MNTVKELIERGLNERNAESIVGSQRGKIGTEHGDYIVEDVNYLSAKQKEVLLRCKFCGTKYRKVVESLSGTSWKRLKSVCECQKEAKRAVIQAGKMLAKAVAEERQREEIESRVGKEYGEHRIVGIDGSNYVVQCLICGATKNWTIQGFGSRQDYLCHTHRGNKERFTDAYIGMKNNYLTVVGLTWGADGHKLFRCRCDCGRITTVKPSKWENGTIKSCNCYLANRSANADPKERIRAIWTGMKGRCFSPTNKSYANYGGRGITICPEWMIFENFYKWSMENGYDNTRTIDRIDYNGNYDPQNCRWATWDIQCRNRRGRKSQKYYEEMKNGKTDRREEG